MGQNNTKVKPFGWADKIGYMFGDFGNDFTFILSSSFMLKFYTDVMGIDGAVVGILMMVSRFVDAVTDVTMGQIVDRSKPAKDGKFKPWIKRMCGPVAIASFLIYQSGFADMAYGFKVAWMVVTYLLWGSIFYTAVNIPYGSMASAVSSDPDHRAQLSTWRSIGATLAGLAIGVGTPMVAYVAVDGNTVMSGSRMTIIAGVFSICAIICYVLCFQLVKERVPVPANTNKLQVGHLIKSLVTNRSLIGIIAAAILLLLALLGMQGLAAYVFPNFYGSAAAQSTSAMVGSIGTLLICAPLASRLSSKFGKKEISVAGCFVAVQEPFSSECIHHVQVHSLELHLHQPIRAVQPSRQLCVSFSHSCSADSRSQSFQHLVHLIATDFHSTCYSHQGSVGGLSTSQG